MVFRQEKSCHFDGQFAIEPKDQESHPDLNQQHDFARVKEGYRLDHIFVQHYSQLSYFLVVELSYLIAVLLTDY